MRHQPNQPVQRRALVEVKRLPWILGTGAVLMVTAHFVYPVLFEHYGPHAKHARRSINLRQELGDVGPIYRSALQPGLAFFSDLDEVKFTCYRSFDGSIEIAVRKPFLQKEKPPELYAIQRLPGKGPDGMPRIQEKRKTVSEEVFRELQSLVLRQDLIDRSLLGSEVSTDGSTWLLEGKKGDFVISHRRLNPVYMKDKIYVVIGFRFLELADITIPDDKLY